MAQVKVIGMDDLRGLKSRKTGQELDTIILHCLEPNNGPRSFGYKCIDVFIPSAVVPSGVNWTDLPQNFIIEQERLNSNEVTKCEPLGKSTT